MRADRLDPIQIHRYEQRRRNSTGTHRVGMWGAAGVAPQEVEGVDRRNSGASRRI
jgi:hypothetical protein